MVDYGCSGVEGTIAVKATVHYEFTMTGKKLN
jgi:hypothetical protein